MCGIFSARLFRITEAIVSSFRFHERGIGVMGFSESFCGCDYLFYVQQKEFK